MRDESRTRPVMKEVTEEFVEHFGDPDNRTGGMWMFVRSIALPEGVDPADPRVRRILADDLPEDEIVK